MTAVLEEAPAPASAHVPRRPAAPEPRRVAEPAPAPSRPSPRRAQLLFAGWLLAIVVGTALVVYGLGPLFQDREQRKLLGRMTDAIDNAANAASGLPGLDAPTLAPAVGSPVAVLEIGELELQQVVVEGVGATQTRRGPGHVPGTTGLGQVGNSVVVGRRAGFGGPFGDLDSLEKGHKIVVATAQGQSVYEVTSVEDDAAVDAVYGSGDDDEDSRLTLVTSADARPWNTSRATVVVAKLQGKPFEPTPQGGRTADAGGTHGDHDARAAAVLAVLFYGLVLAGTVVLYRRLPTRTAYLLTVCPVLAATVVAAETFGRLLPAWL